MSDVFPSLNNKILRKSNDPIAFALYRAALEWSLIDPIVIDGREDLKSETTWHDRVEPFHHQVTNLITFCRRLPVTLIADDVGLGKTISAGLIASELISRRRVNNILIVAPKLLGPQWKEELESKFNIPSVVTQGKELIDAVPNGEVGAVITTYHAARDHMEKLPEDRFQMLILDEAHKLRNLFGVAKPPQVALRFREALEQRMFRYVLMLTATPIQNRLWDLYSLIELLSVARGHENPFGREGMFARRYIADKRSQARQLKPDVQDEFRSIVYGYMSRVRRGDADLQFPERTVLLRDVKPTEEELILIEMLIEPLEKMNRLAQISILQALTSSPDALAMQLGNMARKGTFPEDIAKDIQSLVNRMPRSAKLEGLAKLVRQLRKENPDNWRMVIFTQRRETQTTIEAFLESEGISVGIINGDSGGRNQDTIARFRADPPEIRVIVSTEAGSEGVNLQAANVLVNFDLPWNPMIVEQRIGRIQRLASKHAKVFIYSVILSGTFEEYIVARLMEKLQMASHAIGDIEALLEASGMDGDESSSQGFEEEIRRLVMESLAGIDVKAATRKAVESINKAKEKLKEEEENINTLLGNMDDSETQGPLTPDLPINNKSMDLTDFVPAALQSMGATVIKGEGNTYSVVQAGQNETIFVSEELPDNKISATIYSLGTTALDRLISRMTVSGLHNVIDADENYIVNLEHLCRSWVNQFGGIYRNSSSNDVSRSFSGSAALLVRVTVAHDSYERLLNIACDPDQHKNKMNKDGLHSLNPVIESPSDYGVNEDILLQEAIIDEGIAEFCRFYKERREKEVLTVQGDERKRKKLYDEFTPRFNATLVGLQGQVSRIIGVRIEYQYEGIEYSSYLSMMPSTMIILQEPDVKTCTHTGHMAPADVFDICSQSKKEVLGHLLIKSAISTRKALPEYTVRCTHTGELVLADEIETSDISGQVVAKTYIKRSAISGVKGEPNYFGICEFTKTQILLEEIFVSQISGKSFRLDQLARSAVSGKTGHISEFVQCELTKQYLLVSEAEKCEITGTFVLPHHLVKCEISGLRVLPSELQRSEISGRKALKKYIYKSSLSQIIILEDEAIKSHSGNSCAIDEAIPCNWCGLTSHPEDLTVCEITGLRFSNSFLTKSQPRQLELLLTLLTSPQANADRIELWPQISKSLASAFGGKTEVESSIVSSNGKYLAISGKNKKYLGLKTKQIGGVYSIKENRVIGRIASGRRQDDIWLKD